jgi:hypothetical protein
MVSLVENIALVMLSLALMKNLVGLISPKTLMGSSKSFIKKGRKNIWAVFCLLLAPLLIYASYSSGLSLAQWIVAGYSAILILFPLLFYSGDTLYKLIESFTKTSENTWRIRCGVVVILAVYGIYVILQ